MIKATLSAPLSEIGVLDLVTDSEKYATQKELHLAKGLDTFRTSVHLGHSVHHGGRLRSLCVHYSCHFVTTVNIYAVK